MKYITIPYGPGVALNARAHMRPCRDALGRLDGSRHEQSFGRAVRPARRSIRTSTYLQQLRWESGVVFYSHLLHMSVQVMMKRNLTVKDGIGGVQMHFILRACGLASYVVHPPALQGASGSPKFDRDQFLFYILLT